MRPPMRTDSMRDTASAVLLIIAVVTAIFAEFLIGDKRMLFTDIGSDSLNGALPAIVNYARHVHAGHLWGWSFEQGLGQALLPSIAANVFALPLLMVPLDAIPSLLGVHEAAKVVCGGCFVFLFLRERGAAVWTARIGAVLYATSGYIGIVGSWSMLSTEGAFTPMIFFGAERLRHCGRAGWLILAVTFMAATHPFLVFVNGLAVAFYLLIASIDEGTPRRDLARTLVQGIAAAALGVAIAGIVVLPTLAVAIDSPRLSGGSSFTSSLSGTGPLEFSSVPELVTAYLRAFAADLAGNGSDYWGWRNFLEAPLFSCGTISMLAVPLAWPHLGSKRRRAVLLFAFVIVAITALPWFRFAFWGFTGNYYRTINTMVSLCAIVFAVDALALLQKHGGARPLRVLAIVVALLSPLAIPAVAATVNASVLQRVMLLVFVAATVLAFPQRLTTRAAWPVLLLLLACFEGVWSVRASLHARPALSADEDVDGIGYRDATAGVVDELRLRDAAPFRVAKWFHSSPAQHGSLNDGMMQQFFGVSAYSSFNAASSAYFFEAFGRAELKNERSTRWLQGLENSPALLGFLGARYALARNADPDAHPFYILRDTGAALRVYENPLALPMAFSYDAVLPRTAWLGLSELERQKALFIAAIIEDGSNDAFVGVRVLDANQARVAAVDVVAAAKLRRAHAAPFVRFTPDEVRVRSDEATAHVVFFSIPHDRGWHAFLDDVEVPARRVAFGFIGVRVDAGAHEVALRYRIPGLVGGFGLSVFGCLVAMLWAGTQRWRLRPA